MIRQSLLDRPTTRGAAAQRLRDAGWALFHDQSYLIGGRPDERAVLDLASAFGTPSARDGGRAVWPVAPAPGARSGTFSVRAGQAAFHTDAQYHDRPEDYLCLFGVLPAADGGVSRVLTVPDALAAVRRDAFGPRLSALLAEPVWRWRVPAVFGTRPAAQTRSVARRALESDGRFRWRSDNLDLGGPGGPVPARTLGWAAARIGACLDSAPAAVRVLLGPGDVLVVDNRRALHARTWFSDPSRLLMRVRLWEES
jgi:alpha-ketoglutarate-dependent taurine dioxygenase